MKKIKLKTLIVGLIIISIVVAIVLRFKKSPNEVKFEKITAKKIEVYFPEENYLGDIWIENQEIKHNLQDKKLSQYIEDNRKQWEIKKLEYPVGGCNKDMCWDGSALATIDDPGSFLVGLTFLLEEREKLNFDFRLVQD